MFNTDSPHQFYLATIDKSIDMDGVPEGQPYQCVDPWKAFTKSAYGFSWALGGSGGAKELWLQRSRYAQWFDFIDNVDALRDGDWVVWNGAGNNPYGHVAMFRTYSGGGLLCLGQNQPSPRVTQAVISRANFLGALRPKKYNAAPAPTPAPAPQPAPQPAPNPDVKVGSTVRPKTAVAYNGAALAAFVTQRDYPVTEVNGDRAVLGNGLNTAFRTGNLTVVAQPTPAPEPAPAPAPAPELPVMGGKVRTSATNDAQNGAFLNLRIINDGESVWTENNSNGFAVLRKGNTVRAAVPIETLSRA